MLKNCSKSKNWNWFFLEPERILTCIDEKENKNEKDRIR